MYVYTHTHTHTYTHYYLLPQEVASVPKDMRIPDRGFLAHVRCIVFTG